MFEAEFWVAVSFIIFVGTLVYLGVHRQLVKSIDGRRERITAELDEARRLRSEAEALLATYQRKQHEAEQEAQAIIAGAEAEAKRLATEAEAKLEEFIARHTKMAEGKIAQAEAQALADVRSAAAEAAAAAAEMILSHTVKDKVADDLIAKGIADVKGKLN
jgi:F-type H+-transporting ATPase subunit b